MSFPPCVSRRSPLEAPTRSPKCMPSPCRQVLTTLTCCRNHVRKAIARVLTVLSHNERASVRAACAGKQHLPRDLRAKKTRALRRKLTKFEATRETVRQHKKAIHNKPRNFAIKV